jgi:hypothetical protein
MRYLRTRLAGPALPPAPYALDAASEVNGVAPPQPSESLSVAVRRRLPVALGRIRPLALLQHLDEHRPKRPILLAVDQQLGEGATLRSA